MMSGTPYGNSQDLHVYQRYPGYGYLYFWCPFQRHGGASLLARVVVHCTSSRMQKKLIQPRTIPQLRFGLRIGGRNREVCTHVLSPATSKARVERNGSNPGRAETKHDCERRQKLQLFRPSNNEQASTEVPGGTLGLYNVMTAAVDSALSRGCRGSKQGLFED
eukprot:3271116-Rhodomonas_salina.1